MTSHNVWSFNFLNGLVNVLIQVWYTCIKACELSSELSEESVKEIQAIKEISTSCKITSINFIALNN